MFWIILFALLVLFTVMFFLVKSGRLTVYMLTIDAALIQAQPLFESIIDFDFTHILTSAQQHWLIFIVTFLAAVARVRKSIKDGMGML